MKRFFTVAAAVLAASCGKTDSGSYPAKVPDAGEIPVMGWHSIPGTHTSEAMYREMRDAGFTLSYTNFRGDNRYLKSALDAAEKAGMKIFLRCAALEGGNTDARKAIVDQYKDHPALAGWFLDDEPAASRFDALKEWKSDIRQMDTGHPCYVNLFPDLGNAVFQGMGVADYEAYVDLCVEKLTPEFLSFDCYPVVKDLAGKTGFHPDLMFRSLELISVKARRARVPFWAFALSTAHTPLKDPNRPVVNSYDDHFPVPTIEHLRIQMWNNLAYGAQALQYFTYWTPDTGEDSNFWYGEGPKKADGTTGLAYPVVKQMNGEIQKLNGVFNGCTVKWVRHTGQAIPAGTKALGELPRQIGQLTVSEPGAVVSLIENRGFTFLVLVSRTLDADTGVSMTSLSEGVKRVAKDASIVDLAADGKYSIMPGDILIFVLDGPRS